LSHSKIDRNFPINWRSISDVELAGIIAQALRDDFGDTPSAVKQIAQITSANLRAVKNWYDAKNLPTSRYLLALARSSPSILRIILLQIGGEELWDVFQLFSNQQRGMRSAEKPLPSRQNLYAAAVRVNGRVKLNERQTWFLLQLAVNPETKAEDIASHSVTSQRSKLMGG
jgi:hypothetical protein